MVGKTKRKLWGLLAAVAGIGLVALLCISTQSIAQPQPSTTKAVLKKFVEATDLYNKGEYEKAKVLFDQVKAQKQLLTPAQQRDLDVWISFNDLALRGRQRYAEVLILAEKAVDEGRVDEGNRYIKELEANPYPTPAQRAKLQEIKGKRDCCRNPSYRDYLKSAHAAFDSGDLDNAERLCQKSIEVRPFFHTPDWGDTPEKLLERIKAAREFRANPNGEKKEGFFQGIRNIFSKDPPKDIGPPPKIIDFDANQPPGPGTVAPMPQQYQQTPPYPPQQQPLPLPQGPLPLPQGPLPLPPPPQSSSGLYPSQPAGTVRMSQQELPPTSGNIVPTAGVENAQTAERRRQAVELMRDALHALNDLQDLGKAREFAERAQRLNVPFAPNDPYNPDRLLNELYRRDEGARIAAGGKPGENPAAAPRPQDARALLAQARDQIKKEQWDEAQRSIGLATQAASESHVKWSLFEDNPDSLQRKLNEKRAARNRERAVLLMLQARKEFNEGHLAEAKDLALEAKELHGPYSLLDTMFKGERAQNLIDEIARLELKNNATRVVSEKKDLRADDSEADFQLAREIARRNQALALMAEAGTLRKSGDLIKARSKLTEAAKLNAVFGPNDQTPNSMLADLQAECGKVLDAYLRQSRDLLYATADPGRFEKTMAKLREAKQLCLAFGLTPVYIDQSIAWAMQVQNMTPPPEPELTPMQKEGKALLDQARFELDKGQLFEARKLAEKAMDDKYAIRGWAEAMLRTLDNADREVARKTANDGARSMIYAFQHKEYRQAAEIFKHFDVNLIDQNLLAQVRDILSRPEMKSARGNADSSERGFASARDDDPPAKAPGAGNAAAGDMTEGTDLRAVRAMEKVQFDWWRERSISVQKNAIELCKTDPATAIARLEEFLAQLNTTKFNISDQEALTRPIESRIGQYRVLLAQREWWEKQQQQVKARSLPGDTTKEAELNKAAAQQQTYLEVQERMKKAGQLMKEGKYDEALQEYEICQKLVPTAQGPIIGIKAAITKQRMKIMADEKNRRDTFDWDALRPDYLPEGVTDPRNPMHVPREFYSKRPSDAAKGYAGVPPTQAVRMIEAKLREPVSVDLKDATMKEAIFYLQSISGLNIVDDTSSLRTEGINLDERVSLRMEVVELRSVLNVLLSKLRLTYVIRNDYVLVTTERGASGRIVTRTYPIADLVVPIPDYVTDTFDSLHDAFRRHVAGNLTAAPPSPQTAPFGIPPGVPVGVGGYSGYQGNPATAPSGQADGGFHGDRSTAPTGPALAQTLISVVTDCVAQNTWQNQAQGGQGTIRFFPLGNALIVNQTEEVHDQINSLLTNLRRMQEVQVAIEMRVLTLSDSFYDLVNLNFEMGNMSNYATGAPQKIAGMAPAGSSPDMSIPFKNIVGAFTGPVGVEVANGSIAIGAGVSFLNEIQVHMFMEAARADKHSQTLANPRLTVISGQTAKIGFNKYKFFNTSAMPIQNGAQVFFMPQNNPFPYGINMQVTPIVSGDRRFVRLHLVPNITNLVSNNVPAMPVEIPVPQIFDGRGDARGGYSVVKMYFQQPEFETVSLNTTVNVPDGATVLLGGLKTMAEMRTETGAPVVSSLPFPLNRLFRNTSYTRDARSLMIMVTPRIIVNEAEMEYQPQPPPMMPQTAYQQQ